MKNAFVIIIAAALLVGCTKHPDPKITALEKRLSVLELVQSNSIASVENGLSAMMQIVSNDRSNWNALLPALEKQAAFDPIYSPIDPATGLPNPLFQIGDRVDSVSATVSNLIVYINATRTGARFVTVKPLADVGQMPADVAAQIRAEAEREWPNDYHMQIVVINQQVEAWQKLHQ